MTINHFLSCDWGTSNFRLRLVALPDLNVLAEVSSEQGVSVLDKSWKEQKSADDAARYRFYTDVLKDHVGKLAGKTNVPVAGLRIVISGMATSTIGFVNLPYKGLPVMLDGSDLATKILPTYDQLAHDVVLISGVRSDDDVMRGEETQLIGCLTPDIAAHGGRQLIIHPGTHSKHMYIEAGQLTDFKTFMTGEAFKIFTTHGILRDNIVAGDLTEESLRHFINGVEYAQEAPLLHALFRTRTNDLFGQLSKEHNYHFLSGLLIGTELSILKEEHLNISLCCGPAMYGQYVAALQVLGLSDRVNILPPEWEEGSVVRGQATVLKRLMTKESEEG